MVSLEFHQLQYAVAVAEELNFTRAADKVSISQSTLSHQLAKLEDELGVKLFERTSRSVHVTQAGEDFVRRARLMLTDMVATQQSMEAFRGLLKGTLRIGTIASTGAIENATLLAHFHQRHPNLNFSIVQAGTYDLLKRLHSGEIDIAILTQPADNMYEEIEFTPLAEDYYVLAVPPDHPLAGREEIDLEEAADEPFVFYSMAGSLYYTCMDACKSAGFRPNIVCYSDHAPTRFSLISAGMGVGFFPQAEAKHPPYHVAVVKLRQKIRKNIVLAVPGRSRGIPVAMAFCQFILQWVRDLGLIKESRFK